MQTFILSKIDFDYSDLVYLLLILVLPALNRFANWWQEVTEGKQGKRDSQQKAAPPKPPTLPAPAPRMGKPDARRPIVQPPPRTTVPKPQRSLEPLRPVARQPIQQPPARPQRPAPPPPRPVAPAPKRAAVRPPARVTPIATRKAPSPSITDTVTESDSRSLLHDFQKLTAHPTMGTSPTARSRMAKAGAHVVATTVSLSELRRAIILKEILDPPLALRDIEQPM